MALQLTGNRRHRANWWGKLILQIEVSGTQAQYTGGHISMEDVRYWRDATVEDFLMQESANRTKTE